MNFKKLSAYTIARNCTDANDLEAGIQEMREYFNACERTGKEPVKSAYIRLYKLKEKLIKTNL